MYRELFGAEGQYVNAEESVMNMIMATSEACVESGVEIDGSAFQNKIVLSIAIRVAAEKFMIEKMNDAAVVDSLGANQSYKLLQRFEQECSGEVEALDVVRSVLLMTPENIHLNSFMYEPIVDMSDEHLKRLYRRVKGLTA